MERAEKLKKHIESTKGKSNDKKKAVATGGASSKDDDNDDEEDPEKKKMRGALASKCFKPQTNKQINKKKKLFPYIYIFFFY